MGPGSSLGGVRLLQPYISGENEVWRLAEGYCRCCAS